MRILPVVILAITPVTAWAGNLDVPPTEAAPVMMAQAAPSPDLIFTLRGGIASTPDYFGSDEYTVGPDFAFRLNYLRLPGGRDFGTPNLAEPTYGVGLRGSFRYISERSSDDNSELSGLDDVDTSVELGLGIGYSSYIFDAFADLRYGVIGHDAFVGEVGADLKVHPTENLTLAVGPRLFLGSDDYASTYFGVSDDEAVASQFDAYDANGGLLSAGMEIGARYEINQNWGIEGAVTWDRFTGDAENSPIVENGDRDQYGLRVGVTRLITLDF
ncbi:MipA/OmpV family protein [Palleronia aestuarii]|nr:MipA/OmpV family protein [Palleronia aestuarii]